MLNYEDRGGAHSLPWHGGIEIAAFRKTRDGGGQFATLQWEPLKEDDITSHVAPLLSIRMEQAQVLMDDLWNAGVRPTEGAGSAGAMRAAERHIEDLRKVAFAALGIEK